MSAAAAGRGGDGGCRPCRCRHRAAPASLSALPSHLSHTARPLPPRPLHHPPPDWSQEPPNGTAQAVLAPNVAVHARLLRPPLPRVQQAEGCSAACRATPNCSWFEYCPAPVGDLQLLLTPALLLEAIAAALLLPPRADVVRCPAA